MKKLRRGVGALLCTALVLMTLICPAAAAPLYFTSLNDSLEQLTTETMPLWFGGTLYVPLSLFSASTNTTKVDLGVNVSYSSSGNTATLFNLRKMLVFDLDEGTCYSDLTGEMFTGQAISRSGRIYVPVGRVCDFFGFSWSYTALPTVEGGYLVRIKNDGVVLDDAKFIDAATELIGRRLRDYNQRMEPESSQQPDPKPVQPQEPERPTATNIYLGFRCADGEELTAVLDRLDSAGKLGVFFMTGEQIAQWDDQVRRMAGTGHVIALDTAGEELPDVLEQLEQGQRALERAAFCRTVVTIAADKLHPQLEEAGWICWQDSLTAAPEEGQSAASFSRSVVRKLGSGTKTVYLTLEGEGLSQALPVLLRQLEKQNFAVAVPLETKL